MLASMKFSNCENCEIVSCKNNNPNLPRINPSKTNASNWLFSYSVLSNFLAWKVVEPLLDRLGDDFRAIYLKFNAVRQGVSAQVDRARAEKCVDIVTDQFPNAVGSLYVQNIFRMDAKKDVNNLF